MKQIINPKLLSTIMFLLSIILLVKVVWIVISIMFLPEAGEELNLTIKPKALYYRVKLSSNAATIEPIKPTKKVVSSMRGVKLIALYNSSDVLVVTIEKNRKTTVLSKGDNIDGFTLKSAGADYALFTKDSKEFKLKLNEVKTVGGRGKITPTKVKKSKEIKSNNIREDNGIKIVNRELLTAYTSNPKNIWKDIGIVENKKDERLNGFKINYVKKGSDFEKLGLRRGDILTAINAEELDNLGAVMSLYGEINNIENLTLTIERDGISKDIEYEIK